MAKAKHAYENVECKSEMRPMMLSLETATSDLLRRLAVERTNATGESVTAQDLIRHAIKVFFDIKGVDNE